MSDLPVGRWLLAAFLLAAIAIVCLGQSSKDTITPKLYKVVPGMSQGQRSLFSCRFLNVSSGLFFSWAVNGIAISNSTSIFNPEYEEIYKPLGMSNFGSLISISPIPYEHHLLNFTCRLYDTDDFVTDSKVEPVHESAVSTLKVINRPSESDPICELYLTQDHQKQQLIEVNCCVQLTREAMTVSLIQGTVMRSQKKTAIVEDWTLARQQCFKHTVYENALSTGNFECIMRSETFDQEQKCLFETFKPKITLSRIEGNHATLTCTYESYNIIGYSWNVDKEIEYELSQDGQSFYVDNKDKKTITVSCTVFTKHGYGSSNLQLITRKGTEGRPSNQSIVIIVGCVLAGIIIFLFFIIIAYLILIRGICFCFPPPDRYSQRDLRRMQLERESIAHFSTLHSHSREGVQLVVPNGGHRYHAAASEDDVPPVPGGNALFSSHLLDYADIDHGNTPSHDVEEMPAPPPQRSDNTKVEYADILKPPTTSLRDMS